MLLKNKKILRLTLKKKWFDMIASGVKKEEYRELKDFWFKRLEQFCVIDDIPQEVFREFDYVEFKHGYAKKAPTILCVCKGISIGHGNPDWGAEPGRHYYRIKLGLIVDKINLPD